MLALFFLLTRAIAAPYGEIAETVAKTSIEEFELGRQYHALLGFSEGVSQDPELNARLGRIAREVVKGSERPDMLYRYQVLDTDELNACALPGGYISVNRGLMSRLTDAELAFVVGHEFAHVTLRHGMASVNVEAALEQISESGLNSVEGKGADPTTPEERKAQRERRMQIRALARDSLLAIQRTHELEADLFGALTAIRAGYDPANAITALEKLEEGQAEASWFGVAATNAEENTTHPSTARRITELRTGIAKIQELEAAFANGVSSYEAGDFYGAAEHFRMYLTAFPNSPAAWANLGLATLAQLQSTSSAPYLNALLVNSVPSRGAADPATTEEARRALQRALELDPTHVPAMVGMGVLARLEGDLASAEQFIETATRIAGPRPDLQINLANILGEKKKWRAASRLWKEAGKDPAWAQLALLNQAWADELGGRRKAAVAGWSLLASNPVFQQRAYEHLSALDPKLVVPARTASAQDVIPSVDGIALGTPLADVIARFGPAPSKRVTTSGEVLAWPDKGVSIRVRDAKVEQGSFSAPGHWTFMPGLGIGSPSTELYAKLGEPDANITSFWSQVTVYARAQLGFEFDGEGRIVVIHLGSLK